MSVRQKINKNNRRYCMSIFGYDFMLDRNLRSWLIEVNTNPCLEESNKLLSRLIPRMLDDMLKIVLDPLFGTTLAAQPMAASESETGLPVQLEYPVDGYSNQENMFKLLMSPASFV